VFQMAKPKERASLLEWIQWADVLLNHNIAFDLLNLRALPQFRRALSHNHLLVDTQVLNYLDSEIRPERTLKNISPLLGTHVYARTLKDGRFPDPISPDPDGYTLPGYNAEDTHATTLNAAELARRILDRPDRADTHKLSAESLSYFSDCIWGAIVKAESGLPMSTSYLRRLGSRLQARKTYTHMATAVGHNLLLGGKDSVKSQAAFIDAAIVEIGQHIRSHPMLEHTDKRHDISWSIPNRLLLRENLPPSSRYRTALVLADSYKSADKTLGYVEALLDKTRQGKYTDRLIPHATKPAGNSDTQIGYTTWYITPSAFHDESDEGGGQIQARPSCKNPPAQTFPPIIRLAYQSRWEGGVILVFDFSQHELRTAALLSGDPFLVAAYQENRDLHAERAQQIFGREIIHDPKFQDYYRQAAKHTNFTDLNLGGPEMLQHTIKKKGGITLPIAQCRAIVADRRNQRPGLSLWQDAIIAHGLTHHYIELPFTGHSRSFIGIDRKKQKEMVNFCIQAPAAITVWYVCHHFLRHFYPDLQPLGCLLFLNLYDALWLDCRTEKVAKEASACLYSSMEEVQNNGYWSRFISLTGNNVPLGAATKLLKGPNA